jgi:hypothetical protein
VPGVRAGYLERVRAVQPALHVRPGAGAGMTFTEQDFARELLWRHTFGRESIPQGDSVQQVLDLLGRLDPFNQRRMLSAWPEISAPWAAFQVDDPHVAVEGLRSLAKLPHMPPNDRSEWRARGTVHP